MIGGMAGPASSSSNDFAFAKNLLLTKTGRMVRFQPQYPPVQKRLAILSKDSRALGAVRTKVMVAVARRLAVDLWRLYTGRCTAEQLGFTI